MFRFGSIKSTLTSVKKFAFTSCDEDDNDDEYDVDSSPSLIEQVELRCPSYCNVMLSYQHIFSFRLMLLLSKTRRE